MIRTRFAPSPTGSLHIGGVRTALFAWLFAKKNKGEFLLRIEDTDRERSNQESLDSILDGLSWLQIDSSSAPIFQSLRGDLYQHAIDQLIVSGRAYACDCTKERVDLLREELLKSGKKPKYDGACSQKNIDTSQEGVVIRFRSRQSGHTLVHDLIKGDISFPNEELDDLIIRRSDGSPTYNLCVAVDDTEMMITHVIRGDDHLSNTPRQVQIIEALEQKIPLYAHVHMIFGEDGKKLSKRHGATSIIEFKNQGYMREPLLNYLAKLGWSMDDQEIFSIDELIDLFSLEYCSKSPSVFDYKKLDWVSQQHLMNMDNLEVAKLLTDELNNHGLSLSKQNAESFVVHYKERSISVSDMAIKISPYLVDEVTYEPNDKEKFLSQNHQSNLKLALMRLSQLSDWELQTIDAQIKSMVKEEGVKMQDLAQPLRVALVGKASSPGIADTLILMGKEKSLKRIQLAIDSIS
jgi:glutamyl-tRNA synthetase